MKKLPLELPGACFSGGMSSQEVSQLCLSVLQGHIKVYKLWWLYVCFYRRVYTFLQNNYVRSRLEIRNIILKKKTSSLDDQIIHIYLVIYIISLLNKVLYVSPERLCTQSFRNLIYNLKNRNQNGSPAEPVVSLLCVDEVCMLYDAIVYLWKLIAYVTTSANMYVLKYTCIISTRNQCYWFSASLRLYIGLYLLCMYIFTVHGLFSNLLLINLCFWETLA